MNVVVADRKLKNANCGTAARLLPKVVAGIKRDGQYMEFADMGETPGLRYWSLGKPSIDVTKVLLEVWMEDPNMTAFFVDDKKNVVSAVPCRGSDYSGRVYKLTIPVYKNGVERYFTKHAENNIRLLSVSKNCSVQVYELSLVSLNGYFVLGLQESYEASAYVQPDGNICWPAFLPHGDNHGWTSLVEYLHKFHWEFDEVNLPPVEEYVPVDLKKTVLQGREAVVLWYCFASGVGCLWTDKGLVKVHWLHLRPQPQFLPEGSIVTYTSLETPKDKKNTSFELEARGVDIKE